MMDPLGSRAFRGKVLTDLDLFAVSRGEVRPTSPLLVECQMGATLYDVIWTGNVAAILVSDKVVELLTDEGVSGWTTYAVELRDKTRATVEGYSGFVVHGRCGPIRDELSPVVDVMRPGGITQMYKGWHFDPETWDGSDIFMPVRGGIRFARDRVRRLFARHKIRNVKLIKATEDIRPIP